jgi:hypothetical protein
MNVFSSTLMFAKKCCDAIILVLILSNCIFKFYRNSRNNRGVSPSYIYVRGFGLNNQQGSTPVVYLFGGGGRELRTRWLC